MTTVAITKKPATGSRPRSRGRVRWTVVLVTSLAIVGYVVGTYAQGSLPISATGGGLSSTYATRPLVIQVVFYCHITFAAIALLVGPFQFSKVLRRKSVRLHRWVGRTYLVGVGVGSVAAFIMSFFSSVAFDGFFGFGSLALLWGYAALRGYRAIRARDLAGHQAWMIRSFALTYAAVTLRTWLGVLVLLQLAVEKGPVNGDHVYNTAYAVVPFLCWLPNIVVAEFIIRRRGLPSYRLTPTTSTPAPRIPA
jgi:uncharacterized membrane protein